MNYKIYINKNLNREINYSEQAATLGKVNTKKAIAVGTSLSKKLKPFFGKVSIEAKVDRIKSIFNSLGERRLIFLDSWPDERGGDYKFANVAFIFKTHEQEVINELNGNNTVVIYCSADFFTRTRSISFELSRIEILNLNSEFQEGKNELINLKAVGIEFEKNQSTDGSNAKFYDALSGKFTQDGIQNQYWINKMCAFNFREPGRLKLVTWYTFLNAFYKFMRVKSTEKEGAFLIQDELFEDSDKEVFTLDKPISFHVAIKDEANNKFIEQNQKVVITDFRDSDISFTGMIDHSQKYDLTAKLNERVVELRNKIDSDVKLLQEKNILKDNLKYKIDLVNSQLYKIEQDNESVLLEKKGTQEKIDYFKKAIEDIKKELKKYAAPKKAKNKKSKADIDETEKKKIRTAKIEELNESKKAYEDELKIEEKKLDSLDANVREHAIQTQQKRSEQNSLIIDIKREDANIKDLEKKLLNSQNILVKIEKAITKFSGISFYKVSFKPSKKDVMQKKEIIFDYINILKGDFDGIFAPQWTISSFDYGTFVKIQRYQNSINNFRKGYYRNPFQVLSLLQPSLISNEKFEATKEIIRGKGERYKLNEHQIDAVAKAIATEDISYIQGPPGTGKTQTISALAEYATHTGENILISSSTHAAIDNFFERLDQSYEDNPNLFMYRFIYRTKEDRKNNYTENDIFGRFIKAVDLAFEKRINAKTIDTEKLDRFKNLLAQIEQADNGSVYHIESELLEKINFDDVWEDISLFQIIENASGSSNKSKFDYFRSKKADFLNYKNSDDQFENRIADEIESNSKDSFEKYILPLVSNIRLNDEYSKFNEIIKCANEMGLISTDLKSMKIELMKTIESIENNTDDSQFEKLYKSFIKKSEKMMSQPENTRQMYVETSFKETLIENDLLNVIGITTTSRKDIKFDNKILDLFVDYSIDRVIIDEVSKSNTPEILSNIFMATKVNLAGDYRQLNPIFDIEEELLSEFADSVFFEEMARRVPELRIDDENEKVSKLKTYLEKLYNESLFANQIGEISKVQSEENLNSYQYLVKQYRFNKPIMDVVNKISYVGKEELVMGKRIEDFKEYNLNIFGKELTGSINLIDTSYLNQEYIDFLQNRGIKLKYSDKTTITSLEAGRIAFDQKVSLLHYRPRAERSQVNDYNAFAIMEAIENLVVEQKVDPRKIGVISMTNSQAKLIRSYFSLTKIDVGDNGIWIDTVDNFQGSEREIIFVDLVRANDLYDVHNETTGKILKMTKRNLDFYRKPERLNVALSRAKAKLVIVGAIEKHLLNEKSSISINGNPQEIEMFKVIYENIEKGGMYKWNENSNTTETSNTWNL